jgi:hypothetical protein
MNNIKMALLGLPFLLLSYSAQAEIFMCKDASGKTLTSDRPIPDCASAVREFGVNGQLKRVIPAPLTPEQKKQKQAEEEKQKAEAEAAAEQRRQDRAILARYESESDIEAARKYALQQEQEDMKRDNLAMTDAQKDLNAANEELKPYTLKKTKPPATLTRRIETAEATIRETQQSTKNHQDKIAQINAKFDETLKRFRELTTPTASK